MRSWILYSALRLGLFVVLFAGFYVLAAQLWGAGLLSAAAAALVAALAAFCISYIFLARLRAKVAAELAASRTPKPKAGSDEDAEDTVTEDESVGRHGAERES